MAGGEFTSKETRIPTTAGHACVVGTTSSLIEASPAIKTSGDEVSRDMRGRLFTAQISLQSGASVYDTRRLLHASRDFVMYESKMVPLWGVHLSDVMVVVTELDL